MSKTSLGVQENLILGMLTPQAGPAEAASTPPLLHRLWERVKKWREREGKGNIGKEWKEQIWKGTGKS